MYRILILVAVSAMIGGDFLTAQTAQENALPPIVQASEVAGNQGASGQRWTPQRYRGAQSDRVVEPVRNEYVPAIEHEQQAAPSRVYQKPQSQTYRSRQQTIYQTPPRSTYQTPPRSAYQTPSRSAYQSPPRSTYQVPANRTLPNYRRAPQQAVQQYSRQTMGRNYVPPIPKDSISLRDPTAERQVAETKRSKADQQYKFVPRRASDSFSYRREEYGLQNANTTPTVAQQNAENPTRRIIQLKSRPIARQSVPDSEPAPFVERKVVEKEIPKKREAALAISQQAPPKPLAPMPLPLKSSPPEPLPPMQLPLKPEVAAPFVDLPSTELVEPEEVAPKVVKSPRFPVYQSSPLPKVEKPKQEVIESTPFRKPSSFSPKTKRAPVIVQERTLEALGGTIANPPEPVLSVQPETKIQKRSFGNDFSPVPKVKEEFNNSFLQHVPKKKLAAPTIDPFGSAEKQAATVVTQADPPVPALEMPAMPARVAAKLDRQPSEAGGWWWYLLPVIPLFLIGWFVLRGLLSDSPQREFYEPEDYEPEDYEPGNQQPITPVEPEVTRYSDTRIGEAYKEADAPAKKTIMDPVGGTLKISDPFLETVEEKASYVPAAPSADLQVWHQEDEGLCKTDRAETASEQAASRHRVSKSASSKKVSKEIPAERKLKTKPAAKKSKSKNVVPTTLGVSSPVKKDKPLPLETKTSATNSTQTKKTSTKSKVSSRVVEQKSKVVGGEAAKKPLVQKPVAEETKPVTKQNVKSTVKRKAPKSHVVENKSTEGTAGDPASSHTTVRKNVREIVDRDNEIQKASKRTASGIKPKSTQVSARKKSGFKISETEKSEAKKSDSAASVSRNTTQANSAASRLTEKNHGAKKRTAAESVGSKKTEVDDLTKIRGIGVDEASWLRDSGIGSYEKLAKAGPEKIKQILKSGGSKFQFVDPTQWPEQAALAAKGDWKGLKRWKTYFKELPSLKGERESSASAVSLDDTFTGDDLTKIRGIGPEVASHLRDSGIDSFRKLTNVSPEKLKLILKSGGPKFQLVNPTQWHKQATFAVKGDWDGLIRWQAKFKQPPAAKATEVTGKKNPVRQTIKKKPQTSAAKASASDKDDLTRINGIGPATQRFLNQKDIFSFAKIASMSNEQLKGIFANVESRFQLLNTETWAEQAKGILESFEENPQSENESGSKPSIANVIDFGTTGFNSTNQSFSN